MCTLPPLAIFLRVDVSANTFKQRTNLILVFLALGTISPRVPNPAEFLRPLLPSIQLALT